MVILGFWLRGFSRKPIKSVYLCRSVAKFRFETFVPFVVKSFKVLILHFMFFTLFMVNSIFF